MTREELIREIDRIGQPLSKLEKASGVSETTLRRIVSGKNVLPSSIEKLEAYFKHATTSDQPTLAEELMAQSQPTERKAEVIKAENIIVSFEENVVKSRRHHATHEIRIPILGDVLLSDAELCVVDHRSMQRLKEIKQLGTSNEVYPGAVHTRFEHVIGVLGMAQKMMDSIHTNHNRASDILADELQAHDPSEPDEHELGAIGDVSEYRLSYEVSDIERILIRLAALLHDVGHLPYGHTIEDELRLLNQHDKWTRLRKVFGINDHGDLGARLRVVDDHGHPNDLIERPQLSEVIRKEFPPIELKLYGKKIVIYFDELVLSVILKEISPSITNRLKTEGLTDIEYKTVPGSGRKVDAITESLAAKGIRLNICEDIVGNTICADLVDYLHRDWHHAGHLVPVDHRIFQFIKIVTRVRHQDVRVTMFGSEDRTDQPDGSTSDRLVIDLGQPPRIRHDVVTSVLDLLELRLKLSEAVLFHRTKLTLTAVLERSLVFGMMDCPQDRSTQEIWNRTGGHNGQLEDFLLDSSDDELMAKLAKDDHVWDDAASYFEREGYQNAWGKIQGGRIRNIRKVLAQMVRDRFKFCPIVSVGLDEADRDAVMRTQRVYADHPDAGYSRELALRMIEQDWHLPPGTIAMYCPGQKMHRKAAQVSVLIGGQVHRFDEYDKETKGRLTAGQLEALDERYKRMWRVTFYAHPKLQEWLLEQKRIGNDFDWKEFYQALGDYILAFVLGVSTGGRKLDETQAALAARVHKLDSFWPVGQSASEYKVAERPELRVARTKENQVIPQSPAGSPSLWSLFQPKEANEETSAGVGDE